jgi:single-strand DNA-binding protein
VIRASVHGRLGSDPVQRETRGGGAMVTVSIAVNVAKPGDDSATEWFSLVAFGKAAEALAQHGKGDLVSAMGSMTRSTFQGRDGEERTSWSLVAESLISARTVYERPHDSSASARPQGARAPRRPLYSRPPRQPGRTGPDLPDDAVGDLYQ